MLTICVATDTNRACAWQLESSCQVPLRFLGCEHHHSSQLAIGTRHGTRPRDTLSDDHTCLRSG